MPDSKYRNSLLAVSTGIAVYRDADLALTCYFSTDPASMQGHPEPAVYFDALLMVIAIMVVPLNSGVHVKDALYRSSRLLRPILIFGSKAIETHNKSTGQMAKKKKNELDLSSLSC
jgi:hypothetical protein